jgi:hypothetical protein
MPSYLLSFLFVGKMFMVLSVVAHYSRDCFVSNLLKSSNQDMCHLGLSFAGLAVKNLKTCNIGDHNVEDNNNLYGTSLGLPTLWLDNTEDWFGVVETQFHLKHVDEEQELFNHLISSLLRKSLRTVVDLVTHPTVNTHHTAIKESLFATTS